MRKRSTSETRSAPGYRADPPIPPLDSGTGRLVVDRAVSLYLTGTRTPGPAVPVLLVGTVGTEPAHPAVRR